MGKKLVGGFLLTIIISVIIAFTGYYFLGELATNSENMYEERLLPISYLGQIESSLYKIRGDAYIAILLPENRESGVKGAEDALQSIRDLLPLYEKIDLTQEEREAFNQLKTSFASYDTAAVDVLQLIKQNHLEEATAGLQAGTPVAIHRAGTGEAMTNLNEINFRIARELKDQNDAAAAMAKSTMVIVTILGAIISISFAYLLTRSITSPLNKAVKMLEEMGKGHLGMRLSLGQKDEIGVMADTMDQFAEKLQTKLVGTLQQIAKGEKNIPLIPSADDQDEITPAVNTMITTIDSIVGEVGGLIADAREGNLNTRGNPDQFVGAYRDIIIGINDMLMAITTPLNEALRVADLFAHAKFGARFDDSIEVKGDLIALREGLNTVGRELSLVIRDVSEQVSALTASAEEAAASVEEVTAGAASVAQSSSLVSSNADNSVRSVDQVLNAMEDLSSSVSTIAAKVDAVSRLSQEAATLSTNGVVQAGVAEKGITAINGAVNDVGSIIVEIRSQMDEIGKIVDIIGDIADQTNLLALNAAIEAARAGDAGMGFAVVANEVKTLAQESQGSAENIGLIISSLQKQSERAAVAMDLATTEVTKGSDAITETIQFFHTIADQVDDISQNMVEVTTLSEEGAAAVEEITASVSEVKTMSELTAQEAVSSSAASEESSAALNQVSNVISDLSIIASRINDSMERLNG